MFILNISELLRVINVIFKAKRYLQMCFCVVVFIITTVSIKLVYIYVSLTGIFNSLFNLFSTHLYRLRCVLITFGSLVLICCVLTTSCFNKSLLIQTYIKYTKDKSIQHEAIKWFLRAAQKVCYLYCKYQYSNFYAYL